MGRVAIDSKALEDFVRANLTLLMMVVATVLLFVTLEYSLKTHKVLQCYGIHNSKPNDETLHYVNKIWLPYANKTIKQIAS